MKGYAHVSRVFFLNSGEMESNPNCNRDEDATKYSEAIMSAIVPQFSGGSIVCSTVC